jgi:hypothetical protein
MLHRPVGALLLCLVLHGVSVAAAGPREVAAFTLPSRDPQAVMLATRVRSLGAALARARRAVLVDGPGTRTSTSDVALTLAQAQELASAANLDEAARLLDTALEAAARAPHRFADSDALIAAAVTRASIALARGEPPIAARWLEQLLRWAPTLTLTPDEESPRMRAALAAARTRLGPHPELRREDLGGLCAVDELLVARPLGPARIEVLRLRDCKVVATAVVAALDESVLPLLDVAPAANPASTPATPASAPPVWRRGWFWVGVGVAASVTGIVAWRLSEPEEQVDVMPRF